MEFLEIERQFSFELLIFFLFANILALFAVYTWRHVHRGEQEVKHENKTLDEIEARHILANANEEARELIRVATHKAQEILSSAETVKDDTTSRLTEEINDIAQQHKRYLKDASLKYVETYEHMAENAQEEYLSTLHEASQSMAQDAKHTLDMFEVFLKDQTIGYKQQMEKKIEVLRNDVNEYVNEYKKEKLKRVEKAINEIIISVSKIVIGRSLNVKEHNELILRALDEAKKEGFFNHLEL